MSLFYNLSKIDDICAKDKKTEEPADFTGIDTDDPEYIKYQYEIDHYGTGYH